jgi:hypothetical protein
MIFLDLPLHELEVVQAGIDLAVRENALRAGDAVDEVAHRRERLKIWPKRASDYNFKGDGPTVLSQRCMHDGSLQNR